MATVADLSGNSILGVGGVDPKNEDKDVSGTFGATGQSSSVELRGMFDLSLSGTWVATVALERSFDAGENWLTVESYTANIEAVIDEPAGGVLYRLNATAYTSGTVTYRISK